MSVYKDESICEKCKKCLSETFVIVSRRNLKCKSEQLEAYYIAMRRHLLCSSAGKSIFFNAAGGGRKRTRPQVTNDHIL